MGRNLLLPISFCFILSALLNYFTHRDLLISFINPLTLVSSIYLFKKYLITRNFLFNSFFIISLGLIPLFYYLPNSNLISLLPLISVGILSLYKHISRKWVIIIWVIFLLVGNSFSGEIIKYPFNIQNSQLIFNSPEINYNIKRHQTDALFIPFKLRQIVYSDFIFIYAILTNFFDFLNLKDLYDVLLIANLYPIFVGCYKIFMEKNGLRNIYLTTFIVVIFTAGVDRSPDKFQSLYLLGPMFINLIILGVQGINKKLYLFLLLLSLFISISPKI